MESHQPRDVGPEALWNESQFIWWSDMEKNVSGFHRIAHQPNIHNAHIWNVLISEDGNYTRRIDDKVTYEDWMRADGVFSMEGVSFEFRGKGKIFIKVDQDDFEAELLFEDVYDSVPLEAYAPAEIRSGAMAELSTAHYEVGGYVRGFVKAGVRRIDVEGFGHRDHSWGSRVTHQIQSSNWFNGTVGPEFSVFLTNCSFFDGRLMKLGYVVEHDRLTVVKDWDFRPWMDVDGVTFTAGRGWFETEDGRIFDVDCDGLVGGTIVNHGEWIGFESIMECVTKQRSRSVAHKGRFVLERGVNCCGGLRLPGFTVNGANEKNTGVMLRAR